MTTQRAKNDGGGAYHIDPSDGRRSFGSEPSVGQSKPYNSGDNAHGRHEKRTVGPEPGAKGEMPYASPSSGAGGGKVGPRSKR